MGELTTFNFNFKRNHIDWPNNIFLGTLGMSPMEAHVWTPVAKYKKICSHSFHPFSLYTWELNFEQTICDKTQVLLEISWGMHLRTL